MRVWLKFILALIVAAAAVVLFRSLAFTVYTVGGDGLEPALLKGDRVMVNRWSYGLCTGGMNGLFGYGRICAAPVETGDLVAFDSPADSSGGVFVCRCAALPGDTVRLDSGSVVVPGRKATCAAEDYYWMEALGRSNPADSRHFGPVPESRIIGRVCLIVYSHDDTMPFYEGYRSDRTLLIPAAR